MHYAIIPRDAIITFPVMLNRKKGLRKMYNAHKQHSINQSQVAGFSFFVLFLLKLVMHKLDLDRLAIYTI